MVFVYSLVHVQRHTCWEVNHERTLIRLVAVLCTIFLLLALVACGGNQPGGPGKKAPKNVVKIGLINPTTGPLAGFGEGCPLDRKPGCQVCQ